MVANSGCGGFQKARAEKMAEKAFEHAAEGDTPEALKASDAAIALGWDGFELFGLRANLLFLEGRLDECIVSAEKAIELYDGSYGESGKVFQSEMLAQLASAQSAKGDYAKSRDALEKAVEISPEDYEIVNNYAWLLAVAPDDSVRDGKLAVKMAKQACDDTDWEEPHIIDTLAAAYAEGGDFKNALAHQKRAHDALLASADNGEIDDADDSGYQERLKLYESGKAFREDMKAEYEKELAELAAEKPAAADENE